MNLGYTSYFIERENVPVGEQQFFISSPSSISYYLTGCPMYAPGETDENQNYQCPKKTHAGGTFKFSILGLLSGAAINSLKTITPQSQAIPTSDHDRDMAKFKTMRYRSTFDIGAMGAGALTWVSGGAHDGKNFSDLSPDDNLANSTLHVWSNETGDISMSFEKHYSSGSYTRKREDIVSEFGSIPCDPNGGNSLDACSRDLTGFDPAPDSFPQREGGGNAGVKKLGVEGVTTKAELKNMAGAPNLKVSEVREMRITMAPGSCTGRPAAPAAGDSTGMQGTGWTDAAASAGCPWWYRATAHPGNKWAVDKGSSACAGGFDPSKCSEDDLTQDMMIECKPGSCFFIDFHIDLGGSDAASRTVFGNPDNSAQYGWENGVFFMYDPSINGDAGSSGGGSSSSNGLVIGVAVAAVVVGSAIIGAAVCRRKKRSQVSRDAGGPGSKGKEGGGV